MYVGVKESLTAGAAILTASVVALSPLTDSAPHPVPAVQTAYLDLTAVTDPLEAAAIVGDGISSSLDLLAYYAVDAAAAVLVGAYDLGRQDNRSFYNTVRQLVSAPAIIASPTFEALAQVLPPPAGGTDGDPWNNTAADGAMVDFVDHVLRPTADAINAQIAQALHVYPDTGTPLPDPSQAGPPANLFQGAITLGFGVGGTAVRALQAVAVSPLAVARLAVGAAAALTTGDNKSLYLAVRDIVDAPLWAADPAIDALAKVLPGPVGGTDGKHEVSSLQDGRIIQFRDKVLWGATNAVRNGVAKVLKVDPNYGDPLPALKAASVDTDLGSVAKLKAGESVERAAAVSVPAASMIRAKARVPVTGNVSVGEVVENPGTPEHAATTGAQTAVKSRRVAGRDQVTDPAGQLKAGAKLVNQRLRGNAKKTAAQKDTTKRPSAGTTD